MHNNFVQFTNTRFPILILIFAVGKIFTLKINNLFYRRFQISEEVK
jgi:hypothetical protein